MLGNMYVFVQSAKVMDDENLSLFQMGFLKQGKLQGQRIDVPAIGFKVLRHITSIFDSQWIKIPYVSNTVQRVASHMHCLDLARYIFRKR